MAFWKTKKISPQKINSAAKPKTLITLSYTYTYTYTYTLYEKLSLGENLQHHFPFILIILHFLSQFSNSSLVPLYVYVFYTLFYPNSN